MTEKKYVIAIDQGTTSSRAILFDHDGSIVAMNQLEHTNYTPKPGWVEHDPEEIWANVRSVVGGVLAEAETNRHEVAAIGITNQRETAVVWDKTTGKPIYNAIVWQDTRTQKICDRLAAGSELGTDRYKDKVGLPLATYFSGPKIAWILENVPGAREKAEAGDLLFGNTDTWVLWNITGGVDGGVHATDVTNASRTMLMNLDTLSWNEEIANKGQAKNTYGTGCFMLMNTGTTPVPSKNGLLTTVCYQIGDQPAVYALEGSIAVAGSLVQWMRDNLGLITNSRDIEELAASVEDNGGAYFVPAFSGLFAPYWRPDARGALVGLTRYVNKAHIARAVEESTAYQTLDVLQAMNADSGVPLTEIKVDGGMTNDRLLMQFQADVAGVPVVRPKVIETTALGAAYAAGIAVGFWSGTQDVVDNWAEGARWEPAMEQEHRDRLYRLWKKAVTKTLDWVDADVDAEVE